MPGALAAGDFGAATDLLDATYLKGMGKPAGAATDLLDAPNSACMEEFFGSAAIVLGDNGEVSNSKCLGELSAVAATELHGAANLDDFWGIVLSAKGHGNAASVRGDTGSTAFSMLHDSLIRDSRHNSLHHPIHACAHSRLDNCGVGSGVVLGLEYVLVFLGLFLLVAVDDVDDACMDGSVPDVIHPGSTSVIQSFSEYHDSSCARLNALQNSRMERGRHARGGIKPSSTGFFVQGQAVCWEKAFFFSAAVK